ncbi:DMT family transporter [Aquabacterium humicola]|uniref:DMT family transporter n=1 Tax=Aquabacterium humicola TaxID=3237377 RepID=UPI00254299BE|nr:DMT family transporter [Rubrivivax pictus]
MNDHPIRSGTWRMLAAMALSGTIGALVVESGQPPLVVVLFRCAIGGAALLAWLAWTRGWRPLTWRAIAWLLLGGAALVANWLCLFSAYRFTPISVATVVYHTQPFMLLLLAAALGTERLDGRRLPWLALAMAGVLLSSGLGADGLDGASWSGVALAAAAAALYAVATIATQKLQHLPSAQIAALQMGLGVVLLAPVAWPFTWPAGAVALGALATLGLVHTAFMYTLMYAAFQRLPASSLAMLSFVYPAVALLVDLAWFGAWPQPLQWLGMGLILAAVLAHKRAGAAAAAAPRAAASTGIGRAA